MPILTSHFNGVYVTKRTVCSIVVWIRMVSTSIGNGGVKGVSRKDSCNQQVAKLQVPSYPLEFYRLVTMNQTPCMCAFKPHQGVRAEDVLCL